jgi:hypothetical protein
LKEPFSASFRFSLKSSGGKRPYRLRQDIEGEGEPSVSGKTRKLIVNYHTSSLASGKYFKGI